MKKAMQYLTCKQIILINRPSSRSCPKSNFEFPIQILKLHINIVIDINAIVVLFQANKINQAACELAKGVAQEGGVYFAGSVCQTASLYSGDAGKSAVMRKLKEQAEIFSQNSADLIVAEVTVFCILILVFVVR